MEEKEADALEMAAQENEEGKKKKAAAEMIMASFDLFPKRLYREQKKNGLVIKWQ